MYYFRLFTRIEQGSGLICPSIEILFHVIFSCSNNQIRFIEKRSKTKERFDSFLFVFALLGLLDFYVDFSSFASDSSCQSYAAYLIKLRLDLQSAVMKSLSRLESL